MNIFIFHIVLLIFTLLSTSGMSTKCYYLGTCGRKKNEKPINISKLVGIQSTDIIMKQNKYDGKDKYKVLKNKIVCR